MQATRTVVNLWLHVVCVPNQWKLCALVVVLVQFGQPASALPPLGITQVSPAIGPFDEFWSRVEVIDEVAYASTFGGIWEVPEGVQPSFVPITHPTLGEPYRVTRPVKGADGRIYVGASFGTISGNDLFSGDAALYVLDQPDTPLVFWAGKNVLVGLDSQLRGLGNIDDTSFQCCEFIAAEFLSDGSVSYLVGPEGPVPQSSTAGEITATSLSGHAVGSAGIPGTLGRGSAQWTPDGWFSFIDELSIRFADSVRDRADGHGVNIGGGGYLIYGNQEPIPVSGEDVIVSQSNFAVVSTVAGYYPGVVPDEPHKPLLLREIFPELEAFGSSLHVTDITAVDGHLFMSFVADDALYLFGARDPSVIPEPASVILALGCLLSLPLCRVRRPA